MDGSSFGKAVEKTITSYTVSQMKPYFQSSGVNDE
jgi:hypothetical protein